MVLTFRRLHVTSKDTFRTQKKDEHDWIVSIYVCILCFYICIYMYLYIYIYIYMNYYYIFLFSYRFFLFMCTIIIYIYIRIYWWDYWCVHFVWRLLCVTEMCRVGIKSIGSLFEGLPSGKHTKNYWNGPFIVELPINSMVIFHSYVKLPEGRFWQACFFSSFHPSIFIVQYVIIILMVNGCEWLSKHYYS